MRDFAGLHASHAGLFRLGGTGLSAEGRRGCTLRVRDRFPLGNGVVRIRQTGWCSGDAWVSSIGGKRFMGIGGYYGLNVWHKAVALSEVVGVLADRLPRYEEFRLAS